MNDPRRLPGCSSTGESSTLVAFVGVVIAIGLIVIVQSVYRLGDVANPLGWIALGSLAIVAASFALKLPGVPVYLSISDAFFITSALLFGPAPATVTIAIDSFVVSLRRRNSMRQLLFNTTSPAIALWSGAQVSSLLSHQSAAPDVQAPDATMILALASLATVYFLLNSGLLATAVALSKRISLIRVWREYFAIISLNYFAAASAAFFLTVLVRYLGLPAVAAVLPLIVVCHVAMRSSLGRVEDAERHVARVNQLYLSTVSALSTAIEAKDGVTSDHIHRVQAYAMGLARALDVTEPATLHAIEAAALLHDTGKLGIPEHILNKPGKLTPAEFETMKSHVALGADILSAIDFPYPVVPIVRAHHENWDGTGYPKGLRGQDIPIGARILSVVDCFDALVSDRPYRPAMSAAAAVEIIRERRGSMYDPLVVDAFLRVYQDIPIPTPKPQVQAAIRSFRQGVTQPSHQQPPASARLRPMAGAVSDDLLGFVGLARLASGSPAVRDIGAFVWSQLRHVAPGATLALFTVDDSRTVVVSRYIAGATADRVPAMTIPVGERITGWVAANSRPMADANAALDLGTGFEDALRFALSMPLVAEGGVVGVLTLYAFEPFGDQLALKVEMIGPHLAKAVTSATATEGTDLVTTAETVSRTATRRGLSLVSRG
jgi:putative nucleotidyltransferase with HDIG domain